MKDEERAKFEAWVSEAPFGYDIERWVKDERKHAWPGQYKDIAVELAWEAWCEAKGIDLE